MRPVAVATSLVVSVLHPRSAAASRSAVAIGPLPTMTSFGTGQKIVVMRSSLIDVSRGASGSNSSVPVTSRSSRWATRPIGRRSSRRPQRSGGRSSARTVTTRAVPPRVSPATSASTSLMVTSTRRLPTGTSTRAPERSEPIRPPPGVIATASERSRSGKSSVRDDPRHVDFRARAQACHDAQRDVVHGLSLRASRPKHVAQHHARLRVLPRLGRSIECESGVFCDAS